MGKLILLAKVRCDKCIKDHKKCTRELEGCKRCTRIKANCRYSVIKQYKDRDIETLEDSVITFSIKDESMIERDDKRLKMMGLHKNLKMTNTKLVFDKQMMINNFKLRSPYNTILAILGGSVFDKPSDFNMSHDLFSRFYTLLTSQPYAKPIVTYDQNYTFQKEEYEEVQREAWIAYFEYINSKMPLFLRSTFNPAKRGKVLMAAIYACGIPFIKESNISKIIHRNCIDTLVKYLSKSKFYPKLETLQIMLLVNKGLRHVREISEHSWVHFEAISHLAHQLALQLNPFGIQNQETLLERRLCLCAIIAISHIRMITFDAPAPFHTSFYTNQIDLTTPTWKISKNGLDISSMILSECSYYYSLAYIRFCELKGKFEGSFEKLENYAQLSIINLRKKIERVYYKYLNFKSQNLFVNNDESFMDIVRFGYYLYLILVTRYLLLRAKKLFDSSLYPSRVLRYKSNLQGLTLRIIEYVHTVPIKRRTFSHYGVVFYSLCYGVLHLDESLSKLKMINLGIEILSNKERCPVGSDSSPHLLDTFFFIRSLKITI